jgi:hypothetical protein
MPRFDGREALRALRIFLVLLAAAALLAGAVSASRAHDTAEWIQREGWKNAVGELCCGERDCSELADDDVRVTAAGYFIKSLKETVPYSEALPSPTGTYWRCEWGGTRKCFFAPPPNS